MANDPCATLRQQVWAALDGTLDDEQAVTFARHVESCPACRAHVAGAVRLEARLRQNPPRMAIRWQRWAGAAAASLLAALGTLALWPATPRPAADHWAVLVAGQARTAGGDLGPTDGPRFDQSLRALTEVQLALSDGSRCTLAPGSSLAVDPEPPRGRALHLATGRLTVEAAHQDPAAPRIFRTPAATVTVVGTRFTLAHAPATGSTLQVEEGTVRLDAIGAPPVVVADAAPRTVPWPAPQPLAAFAAPAPDRLERDTQGRISTWISQTPLVRAQVSRGRGYPRPTDVQGRPALRFAGPQDNLQAKLPTHDLRQGLTLQVEALPDGTSTKPMTLVSYRMPEGDGLDLVFTRQPTARLLAVIPDQDPLVLPLVDPAAAPLRITCTWDAHGVVTLQAAGSPAQARTMAAPRGSGSAQVVIGDHGGKSLLDGQTGWTGTMFAVSVTAGILPPDEGP